MAGIVIRQSRGFMKQSFFIVLSFFIFISCNSEPSNESSQPKQKFTWSLVTTWPKNYPGLGMAPERFAKLVEEMSEGRLRGRLFTHSREKDLESQRSASPARKGF